MPDLTDTEIVAACARAMNLDVVEQLGELRFPNCPFERSLFNPLTDRAQAMDLVEKLRLSVDQSNPDECAVYASKHVTNYGGFSKDLLRAICLCAARVQIEKETNARG